MHFGALIYLSLGKVEATRTTLRMTDASKGTFL